MNDQTLLAMVRRADPLATEVGEPPDALLERVLAYTREDTKRPHEHGSRPRWWRAATGRRWRTVVTALAVAALTGAGVAAGFGAFEGTPAPPDVSTSFRQLNELADQATQQAFAGAAPQADVSKAHGVIEIPTADGPEDLWAAPNDQGGQCYFIDWANDPPQQSGSKYGFGGCGTAANTSKPISAGGPIWIAGHPQLLTVNGSVFVDAASVKITLHDGSTMTLPVVEHMFLGSINRPAEQLGDARVEKVTAFDAAGNEIANWTAPQ